MASRKTFKVPKSLAACADLLYETKQKQLDLQKQLDELKSQEALLKDHFIAKLPRGEAGGITGNIARVTVVTRVAAKVVDWEMVFRFIIRNDDWALMQRRINDAAVKERWDNGEDVPGVEPNQFGFVRMQTE